MLNWNNLDTLASYQELEKAERINLAEERGEELYDYEGNQIGSGKAELKGYIGEKCYFEIDTETGVSVDAVDKMAMYLQLFSKFNETAGD